MLVNPNLAATAPPPITEAAGWARDVAPDRLINVSQAAPAVPPPKEMREEIARIVLEDPSAHLYGADLGLPALRAAVAERWTEDYGGTVAPDEVAITSGANQGFATAIATLAAPGDEVILPVPWYFNHEMWLRQQGIRPVPLPVGAGMIPDPEAAAALVTPRTRAVALVTPNNPTGAEYPPETVAAFFELCRARGIALILDETYRDFHARPGAPHDLFTRDWRGTLIDLYSFSKAYRLTGHRVGAMICEAPRLAEAEKVIDCVTICPNGIGQRAALWGLRHLRDWVAEEREEILARRAAIHAAFDALPGWHAVSEGAYFAWVEHPWDAPSDAVARCLAGQHGVLALPGTMFAPPGDPSAARALRVAFANLDRPGIDRLSLRLREASSGPLAGMPLRQ